MIRNPTSNQVARSLRHLSIRVPWHDSGWAGTICESPLANSSCLILKGVGEKRDDAKELALAGQSLQGLPERDYPACISERGSFMSPFSFAETKQHPYVKQRPATHGHLQPAQMFHPAYSASTIPYRWMLRENSVEIADAFSVDFDESLEVAQNDVWVQHGRNQAAFLEAFFGHVAPERSLCLFYAKQAPFVEDTRRVLIGVGRVTGMSPLLPYPSSDPNGFPSNVWDRTILHSIRPDFLDGFLLPYREGIALAGEDASFDVRELAVFVPHETTSEFSYVSEHVSNDSALSLLRDAMRAVRVAQRRIDGPWGEVEAWIDAQLSHLWDARGTAPGLGAVLSAFGVRVGNAASWELTAKLTEGDPLALLDRVWERPEEYLSPDVARAFEPTLARAWRGLPTERRQLFGLLSRFSLSVEQAKNAYDAATRERAGSPLADKDILSDPYRLVVASRHWDEPISMNTVDHALFPRGLAQDSQLAEPLTGARDGRRVRAYATNVLEDAAERGNALLGQSQLLAELNAKPASPPIDLNADVINALHDDLATETTIVECRPEPCGYQLLRLVEIREQIRRTVEDRTGPKARRHAADIDWEAMLREREIGVVQEQVDAVRELFAARFSVLIGPAGSGKTTILAALCAAPAVHNAGVLVLAPTGKARVRLQQRLGAKSGKTVAQFLLETKRYDPRSGHYLLTDGPRASGYDTVVIDEASMLTEEMLAAVFEATGAAKRIILCGDPNQLPPIGTGRPFFDIIQRLRPENASTGTAPGFASLSLTHRQAGNDRPDLTLARAFTAEPASGVDDEPFSQIVDGPHLRYIRWSTTDELDRLLPAILAEELDLADPSDQLGFDRSLGGTADGYFNRDQVGVDGWQIIAPNRSGPIGTTVLNRRIHELFRAQKMRLATGWKGRTPRPMGAERIVYGDKVIATSNLSRRCWPDGGPGYVANGETGAVVGQFAKPGQPKPKIMHVAFSTQPGFAYSFFDANFNDNGIPPIELAYALTVHKAQGSEFDLVFLIVPEPCPLLSREMLYTALTRQQNRLVILHQGLPGDLRRYQNDTHSDLARRLTNIFAPPEIVHFASVPYEKRLIHLSSRGEPMRSKSEVIIADQLAHHKIDYAYEAPLTREGVTRWPDFTVTRDATGETFYWEHCGMPHDPVYAKRWEAKVRWYERNGILGVGQGGGAEGSLIVTRDGPDTGMSSRAIGEIIERHFL